MHELMYYESVLTQNCTEMFGFRMEIDTEVFCGALGKTTEMRDLS